MTPCISTNKVDTDLVMSSRATVSNLVLEGAWELFGEEFPSRLGVDYVNDAKQANELMTKHTDYTCHRNIDRFIAQSLQIFYYGYMLI